MKRLFFTFIVISTVFCVSAQDALEQRFDAALRQTKLAMRIKSLRHELEMLKNELQTQKNGLSVRAQAFIKSLASNPDIAGYINRPADSVAFSALCNPEITNKKEQRLYEFLASCAAYRGFIKDGNFFQRFSGSVEGVQQHTKAMLKELHMQKSGSAKNRIFLDVDGGSPQNLAQKIIAVQETIKDIEWHVTMHFEGGHHFLSIIKYDSAQEPLIFMIDTYKGNSYTVGAEHKIIDAHFDVQNLGTPREPSAVSDYNCHLYTFELTKAALHYLQNHDIIELQQACAAHNYERAKEVLHTGMKQYLPYYERLENAWVRKSRDDIEKYNRSLRWKISGQILMSELKQLTQNQKTVAA